MQKGLFSLNRPFFYVYSRLLRMLHSKAIH